MINVVALARLPKESPGDGIEQGRLPRPVGTGDTGQFKGGKVDLYGITVGEEAGKGKVERDHG
jgi:hypothetical protein